MKRFLHKGLAIWLALALLSGLIVPPAGAAGATTTLGSRAVGSVVTLNENGAPTNYIVVNQGKPSDLYDDSCGGTWLLRESIYEVRQWHSGNVNDYANSTINTYLNSTFFTRFDSDIQNAIKQVKIPYRPGSGTSQTVNSRANGLSCIIFLLSDREVGYTKGNVNADIVDDGAKLDYFIEGNGGNRSSDANRRIAYLDGTALSWWLRSPHPGSSGQAWGVNSYGDPTTSGGGAYCSQTVGVRPALVLPSSLLVSDSGAVLPNTAPADGTLGSKAVGSIVTLKENGVPTNYIVVNQGKPSNLYDDSCDGTWLLREKIYTNSKWNDNFANDYANSSIHSYLNNTFLNLFDIDTKNAIKQVKIPYCPGIGTTTTVTGGASGLSTKLFFLSGYEVGFTSAMSVIGEILPADGAKLDYFDTGIGTTANNKRIAYLNGTATRWWLRSPSAFSGGNDSSAWMATNAGGPDLSESSLYSVGVRPALVLPFSLLVSDDGSVITTTGGILGSKAVGSIVTLKENGVPTNYIVSNHGKPSDLYDDSCNGTWLLREKIYTNNKWNSSSVNNYANSTINSYLNSTFLNLFDSATKGIIKQVKIPYDDGNSANPVFSGPNGLSCKIFLLSGYEIGFTNKDDSRFPVDGSKLSLFGTWADPEANNKRIAYLNGGAAPWWIRSPWGYGTNTFHVTPDGQYSDVICTSSCGIRPALILPASTLVSNDGSVFINTAPTTPATITVPSTIQGQSAISIAWDESIDAEGNLTGYQLERSVNGGLWSAITNTTLTAYTDYTFNSWSTVSYRVKAYDSYGLESGYQTSSIVTVIPITSTATIGSKPVGSIVTLKEEGTPTEYIVVHQGKPSDLYDNSCDGTWLLRKEVLEAREWNSTYHNTYAGSTMNSYLNSTFLCRFNSDIQSAIKQVKIPYCAGEGDSITVAVGASGLSVKVFLLSGYEVGFSNTQYILEDGAKLSYFDSESNYKRIAYLGGNAYNWWLRSPFPASPNQVWYVFTGGDCRNYSCYSTFGVRPALILPSSLLTSDDGSVFLNTAPTTPDSINVPSSVDGGSSVAISWTTSTDAENNLAGYTLERSVDDGAWIQIYQGTDNHYTDLITYGWSTISYRVKAYDSFGLESAARTSSAVSVINIAPYKVEHYRQTVEDDGYILYETDSLQGQAGTMADAAAKPYTGFHENTGAADRVPSGQIALDGSLILKLYYDRDTYTVTFDSRGGNAVPSQNGIRYEGLALMPVAPTKTGYLFDGWYSDIELTVSYDFGTPVTNSFTLYAKWVPRTDTAYKVEHYRQNIEDDGYSLYETDELQDTTDATVEAVTKSYTGFQENTGAADRVPSGTVAPDGSLTLKLYYDRDTYTVNFDSRDGNAVPSQNGIRYEGLAVMPVAPTKTGYLFDGWYPDVELTVSYDFGTPVTDSFTLFGKWAPRTDTAYQVEHYQQNVGDDGYSLYETDELQGTTDATVEAVAKGYAGFHENSGVAGRVPSGAVAPNGSLVLKLYYDRDIYAVTFNANGGNMEPSAMSVTYGHIYGTLPIPARAGYKFVGWYTAADGGVNVKADSIVASGADRTLYAQWVTESYGVLDGVVNDADGYPVPGAAITIRAGNVDYKTATTDSAGRFAILGVKYGTYNLVAAKGGVTVTAIIVIQAEKDNRIITLPRGKTNSVVTVLGNAPELVVGGLNTLFDRPEVYTGSDETVVAGGGTVELRMTVEEKDAAALGEDGAQITLAASGMVPLYLDVKLTKNVIFGDGSEVSTILTELPQQLDIIIPLGDTSAEGCRIFRIHNGATDEITDTPNEYGEYFEVQGSSVIVHASRFSTYAIATPASGGSSQYLIKASAGSGGTVSPETAWVWGGGSATVRIVPNEGHSIQSVIVDGKEVGAVESYTFKSVYQNHTLTATFSCPSQAYADLDTGSWYHTAVDVMISRGYMLGSAAGRWDPNGYITRAQMAMILFKMLGTDTDAPSRFYFEDVDSDAWYAGPVTWAASSGVSIGYSKTRFGPDDALTREQLALMLYQFAGEPAGQAEDSETIFFDRSQVSPWAESAVRWAVSAGFLQGDERKLLRPQGTCTRAEAAVILYRYLTEMN